MEETLKPLISYDDYYKLDIRVAKVIWAAKVDGATRLLKLTLDVGILGQKTVVSQLGELYNSAELIGIKVIYLVNTKPKRIRGILSQGSVLTASQSLLIPEKSIKVGSIVQ